ncbi:hypothetical protein BATDEDRAFT_35125 [Batrachochytrium dendrobatidis JAM81]|uniref:Pentacotripeptide-repeat region of PRORP domain-containing protein n=1 Tax=Batrachochytrium dendrobatidis (strain JAM81 / FGSC 10211) TaxID=684364 RepID=F4P3H6_BATDJ|nr:uncharacterized protein BATDEDRAFT_35125 [Batrachochytrium dendrobatidis JAM81]EGF80221.1 hypothetical protein BATDEDRAFT_35125 [Batrachochytrium dendrobatidis JAM81]|eukprot:XP_006679113.1 hypothetical protein BATDEDRAFT_35125 [Batrachochytrium dendrobatidis JAM81]
MTFLSARIFHIRRNSVLSFTSALAKLQTGNNRQQYIQRLYLQPRCTLSNSTSSTDAIETTHSDFKTIENKMLSPSLNEIHPNQSNLEQDPAQSIAAFRRSIIASDYRNALIHFDRIKHTHSSVLALLTPFQLKWFMRAAMKNTPGSLSLSFAERCQRAADIFEIMLDNQAKHKGNIPDSAYFYMIEIYANQGDIDSLEILLESMRQKQIKTKTLETIGHLSKAYIRAAAHSEASIFSHESTGLAYFEKHLLIDKQSASPYHSIARAYAMNDDEDALVAVFESLQQSGRAVDSEALSILCRFFLDKGKHDIARVYLDQYISSYLPNTIKLGFQVTPLLMYYDAVISNELGDHNRALHTLSDIEEIVAYARLGNCNAVWKCFSKALLFPETCHNRALLAISKMLGPLAIRHDQLIGTLHSGSAVQSKRPSTIFDIRIAAKTHKFIFKNALIKIAEGYVTAGDPKSVLILFAECVKMGYKLHIPAHRKVVLAFKNAGDIKGALAYIQHAKNLQTHLVFDTEIFYGLLVEAMVREGEDGKGVADVLDAIEFSQMPGTSRELMTARAKARSQVLLLKQKCNQ